MGEVLGIFVVIIMVAFGAWIFVSALEFIIEVPKQLKRIADALEKRC